MVIFKFQTVYCESGYWKRSKEWGDVVEKLHEWGGKGKESIKVGMTRISVLVQR